MPSVSLLIGSEWVVLTKADANSLANSEELLLIWFGASIDEILTISVKYEQTLRDCS